MLPALATEHLPPELLLDRDNPANDDYVRKTEAVRRLIEFEKSKLSARAVAAVHLKLRGLKTKEIAEKLNVTPTTISKNINLPAAKKLLALMSFLSFTIAGPHLAQRVNMLWRIAVTNEETKPALAISAIAEINKMDPEVGNTAGGPGADNRTVVIINQNTLPQGALDN